MVKSLHVSHKESSSLKASSRLMVSIPPPDINKPYNLRQISQLSWALGFLGYENDVIEFLRFLLALKKHSNSMTTEMNIVWDRHWRKRFCSARSLSYSGRSTYRCELYYPYQGLP